MTDTIALLRQYGEDVGGTEGTLAVVAARWIAVDPVAMSDPLLTDILAKAQFHKATHNGADAFLFGTNLRGQCRQSIKSNPIKSSVLDYFGTSSASNKSLQESLPAATTKGRIYCDGACSANGRRGAKAGFGAVLIHADGTQETVSEALDPAEQQTNQRAELRGLQWAFGKAMSLPEGADIYTDSEYAMKCFTEWGAGWATRGWRKADGKDVLHQDILRPMWETWKRRGSHIRLHHVAAHTGRSDAHSQGNAKADALAVASLR